MIKIHSNRARAQSRSDGARYRNRIVFVRPAPPPAELAAVVVKFLTPKPGPIW